LEKESKASTHYRLKTYAASFLCFLDLVRIVRRLFSCICWKDPLKLLSAGIWFSSKPILQYFKFNDAAE